MFIVSFFGGIASQMDQYAFYKMLKMRYPNVDIKMEINQTHRPDHNGFELDRVFGITRNEAELCDIIRLSDIYPYTASHYLWGRVKAKIRRKACGNKESCIIIGDPSIFHKELLELDEQKSYIISGNFGNFRYYEGINHKVLEDFVFQKKLVGCNKQIADKVEKTNSVSIHVRHGDYSKWNFPTLPLEYYKEAIQLIEERIENPHYYVFSDDIPYITENFKFLGDRYTIVKGNRGEDSYIDMQLMSLCKHNITANSGFSNFAARLNNNVNKICIIPKYHVSWCKNNPFYLPGYIEIDNHKYEK